MPFDHNISLLGIFSKKLNIILQSYMLIYVYSCKFTKATLGSIYMSIEK